MFSSSPEGPSHIGVPVMNVEKVVDCRNHHGEGVIWNPLDSRLWWTDIEGRRLWCLDPVTGRFESISVPRRITCFAPRARGGFIAAFDDGFAFFDPVSCERRMIAPFEADKPQTRPNDGKTDRQGRFIVGGMDERDFQPTSAVWRFDRSHAPVCLFDGVRIANSICFSPDGLTMYFTDNPDKEIVAFSYDPGTGALGEKRVLSDVGAGPGVPDGSCIDAEGYVWNAVWEGSRVVRIAPDGRIDRVIEVPAWKPTCCAFGGPELDTLYITSSRLNSTPKDLERDPGWGGLYAIKPGVRGVADTLFDG